MKQILLLVEILISASLVTAIILQVKGTGLGSSFGSSGEFYRSKRGIELILTRLTAALVALFGLVSLALILVP